MAEEKLNSFDIESGFDVEKNKEQFEYEMTEVLLNLKGECLAIAGKNMPARLTEKEMPSLSNVKFESLNVEQNIEIENLKISMPNGIDLSEVDVKSKISASDSVTLQFDNAGISKAIKASKSDNNCKIENIELAKDHFNACFNINDVSNVKDVSDTKVQVEELSPAAVPKLNVTKKVNVDFSLPSGGVSVNFDNIPSVSKISKFKEVSIPQSKDVKPAVADGLVGVNTPQNPSVQVSNVQLEQLPKLDLEKTVTINFEKYGNRIDNFADNGLNENLMDTITVNSVNAEVDVSKFEIKAVELSDKSILDNLDKLEKNKQSNSFDVNTIKRLSNISSVNISILDKHNFADVGIAIKNFERDFQQASNLRPDEEAPKITMPVLDFKEMIDEILKA